MGKEVYKVLHGIDVKSMLEQKSKMDYLTWSKAFNQVFSLYDIKYKILKNEKGLPYFLDEKVGAMVFTEVTIEDDTKDMWLPVCDGANNPLKLEPYTYEVKKAIWENNKPTGKFTMETKTVDVINMFDVNKTIMRCLVKNLAMFGLGIDVYAGEDLPKTEEIEEKSGFSNYSEDAPITPKMIEKIKELMVKKNVPKEEFFGKKLEEITIAEAKEVILTFTKMKAIPKAKVDPVVDPVENKEIAKVEEKTTVSDTEKVVNKLVDKLVVKEEEEVSVLAMMQETFKDELEENNKQ